MLQDDEFERALDALAKDNEASLGSGATIEEVGATERALQLRIPAAYRRFLTKFGWGGRDGWELLGLGSEVPKYLDLLRITEEERTSFAPRLPPSLLPILNDGGLNLYCLDVSEVDSESPVVLWGLEEGEDQEPLTVADSFQSWFIDRMAHE